jgi:Core-2/I-Branching enzyme
MPEIERLPGRSGPVVFLVLSHKEPALVERLLARLGETETAVTVLHHDAKSRHIPGLPATGRAKLVPNPASSGWGGMEIVQATLRCMRWIRDEIPDFSWIVLISGQDYPVAAPREIESELLVSPADAFLSWEFVPPFVSRRSTDWQRGTSHRYYWHLFPGTHRPIPIPRLPAYFDGVGLHAGSQWWNLDRRAVNLILDDTAMLNHLTRRFRSVLLPDEAFFQTMLLNSPTDLNLVCRPRRFYRFVKAGGAAHPETLTIEDLDEIRASGAFFARKVDLRASAELLDRLDSEHAGFSSTGT